MKKTIIFFLFIVLVQICSGQTNCINHIFGLKTGLGNIVYDGIPNEVFYNTIYQSSEGKLIAKAKLYCKVENFDSHFTIIPDSNSRTVAVDLILEDSTIGFVVFNVEKFPSPRLLYTIPTEIDHLSFPYEVKKQDLRYLLSFEALVKNGPMSYIVFDIEKFEILIIKKNSSVLLLKNDANKILEQNIKVIESLETGDKFSIVNINCSENKKPKMIFSETIVLIK